MNETEYDSTTGAHEIGCLHEVNCPFRFFIAPRLTAQGCELAFALTNVSSKAIAIECQDLPWLSHRLMMTWSSLSSRYSQDNGRPLVYPALEERVVNPGKTISEVTPFGLYFEQPDWMRMEDHVLFWRGRLFIASLDSHFCYAGASAPVKM